MKIFDINKKDWQEYRKTEEGKKLSCLGIIGAFLAIVSCYILGYLVCSVFLGHNVIIHLEIYMLVLVLANILGTFWVGTLFGAIKQYSHDKNN